LRDERGLCLEISPSGGRWWRFKYRIDGKEKLLSMGTYPDTSLKAARERRDAEPEPWLPAPPRAETPDASDMGRLDWTWPRQLSPAGSCQRCGRSASTLLASCVGKVPERIDKPARALEMH
jgi:hypothetical protein